MRQWVFVATVVVAAGGFVPTVCRSAVPSWTLVADAGNGLPSLPTGLGRTHLASDGANLYVTWENSFHLYPEAVAQVWKAPLATMQFVRMPSAGQALAVINGFAKSADGTMVAGGRNAQSGANNSTLPALEYFDTQRQVWVPSALSGAAGWPTPFMLSMTSAPNGDVWAGAKWSGLYYSKDNGRTFAFVDRDNGAQPAPNLNATGWVGDLMFLGNRLYTGSEATGLVYSDTPELSQTWLSADPNFRKATQSTPTVTTPGLEVGDLGNINALGAARDGSLIVVGFLSGASYLPGSVWHFDPQKLSTSLAANIPTNEFAFQGNGMSHVQTLPNGEMVLCGYHFPDVTHTDPGTVDDTGGCYRSVDNGASWSVFNQGLAYTDFGPISPDGVPFETNGSAGGLALVGSDLYLALANGRVYRYRTDHIFADTFE